MQKQRAMLTEITAEKLDLLRKRGNFGNRGQVIDFILQLYELTQLPETLTECVICGKWIIIETPYHNSICEKRTCEAVFERQETV